MTTKKLTNYSGLARLEWMQMIAFTFPEPFVLPFIGLLAFGPVGFFIFFIESVKLAAGLLVYFVSVSVIVAIFVDRWRSWSSGISVSDIPRDIERRLRDTLPSVRDARYSLEIEMLRWNPSDILMGAHVRGIFNPKIVLSGGLVVGLIRGDPRAVAILDHELAHIRHHDQLLPGFIGAAVTDIVGYPISLILLGGTDFDQMGGSYVAAFVVFLYKLMVLGTLVCLISRGRELYADDSAFEVSTAPESYISLLENAGGREKERLPIFHPTIEKRLKEARLGFPSLYTRWPWRAYFAVAASVAWLQYQQGAELIGFDPDLALYGFCVGLAVLGLELLRGYFFKSTISFRIALPGRRFIRYSILVAGFTLAAYVGAESGNPQIGAVVGAFAYALFRSIKAWSNS